jgi:hypothetical protein
MFSVACMSTCIPVASKLAILISKNFYIVAFFASLKLRPLPEVAIVHCSIKSQSLKKLDRKKIHKKEKKIY